MQAPLRLALICGLKEALETEEAWKQKKAWETERLTKAPEQLPDRKSRHGSIGSGQGLTAVTKAP